MQASTLSSPGAAVDAINSPQSSYGSTNNNAGFDPKELTRLLMHETPSQHEIAAANEARAKQQYDRLVEMGARPKRPIRLQPTRTAFYEDGLYHIFDDEGKQECQFPRWMDPMSYHWREEFKHFSNELSNWSEFRKYQQDLQHLGYLETALQLNNKDAALIYALTKLNDWQDFEGFQYHILVNALTQEDERRQVFLHITGFEGTEEQSAVHRIIHGWLSSFERTQEAIEAAKQQLRWIKDQWPKVVAEALASISMAPEVQSSLEMKFSRQAFAAFSVIQKLGGRPSHAVVLPDESLNIFDRILHWSSETSKFMEELLHWKHFLKWQRAGPGEKPKIQWGDYQCPQLKSDLEFSAEFEKFRRLEHESALTWLKFWQRIMRWHEEEIKTPQCHAKENKVYHGLTPRFLYRGAETARSHVRDSEQKVVDAAARLELARQEHARFIRGETGIECPRTPCLPTPSLPDVNSLQSSQSSSSSSSSSQVSIPSSSPASSHSSQSSVPPQSPQRPQTIPSPQASERMCEDRKLSNKGSSANKWPRRSNKTNTRKEAKIKDIDTEQQALPTFVSDSHIVEDDDDIPMKNFSEDSSSLESIEQSYGVESEDTVMTEVTDPPDPILPEPSQPSRPIPNTKIRNLATLGQGPIRKMTRSATKLDQAPKSRVTKNTNKKPATKAKAFTKQQTTMLLDAASNTHSTITAPTLRRSERLREKAAASAATAVPQSNAGPPARPSQQRQPQETADPVDFTQPSTRKKLKAGQPSQQRQLQETTNPMESSQSTTRKKRKREDEELEPLPDSAQKRRRTR